MDQFEIATSKLQMRPRDLGLILEVPFELVPGFESLSVEVIGDIPERSTLDLGLVDPSRIRGWSGGARRSIELSNYSATPGYLCGELPSGRWAVLLSPYGISSSYEIEVKVKVKPYHPRWLRSDLHVHSWHSDGRWSLPELIQTASEAGLDLLALTDHNTISQNIEAETKAEITIKDPVFVVEHTGTVNNSIGGGTENEDWVYVPGNKYSPEGWINATELMQQGYISYSDANNNMLPVTGSASTATWDSKQNEYLNTQGKAVDIIVNKKAA